MSRCECCNSKSECDCTNNENGYEQITKLEKIIAIYEAANTELTSNYAISNILSTIKKAREAQRKVKEIRE